jgi:hypothetical protein
MLIKPAWESPDLRNRGVALGDGHTGSNYMKSKGVYMEVFERMEDAYDALRNE